MNLGLIFSSHATVGEYRNLLDSQKGCCYVKCIFRNIRKKGKIKMWVFVIIENEFFSLI